MRTFFRAYNTAFTVENDRFVSSEYHADKIEKLNGYVYPGFIDSHAHIIGLGMKLITPDLEKARSIDEIIKITRNSDATILRGWDDEILGKYPEKNMLDAIDRPLLLVRRCGHVGVANKKFLKMVEIDSEDGILKEHILIKALERVKQDPEYLIKAVNAAENEFFRYGVTTVHSDDSSNLDPQIVNNLISNLKIDVYEHLHIHSLEEMRKYASLKPQSIKLLLDGSLGARTAFLRSNYDDSNNRGVLNFDPDEFKRIIRLADSNGIQVVAHAIGDGALDVLLDAFESTDPNLRHRIVHVQMAWPDQIEQIKKMNLCVDVQPQFFISDEKMAKNRIGSRMKIAYPFKKFIGSGIRTAFSSDAPVEIPDPLLGIRAAKKLEIDPVTSLLAYTVEGSFQEFDEYKKGSISEGMIGDFIVLSKPIDDESAKVIATYKKGIKVL
ncbi:MAG: amidohydrolase [Thermotogae bacterium]|jgi:predicted amidohydrolase YtcJ|nr:amidohydrolase [Thermotogota bacterium]MCL5032358.1 amidohydrolase [Thermotogota bacterium]